MLFLGTLSTSSRRQPRQLRRVPVARQCSIAVPVEDLLTFDAVTLEHAFHQGEEPDLKYSVGQVKAAPASIEKRLRLLPTNFADPSISWLWW